MNISVKLRVIEQLQQLRVYKTNSLNTQHVVRCPYCGDSLTESHGHFSIKIDPDTTDPMVFRCLKCDISGLLTASVLEELQIPISSDMRADIKSFNKKIIKKNNFTNTSMENFIVPMSHGGILEDRKLEYVNSRLETSFDYSNAQDLKIILNLDQFLSMNQLKEIPGISSKYLYVLNNNYVGFLSTNNNCITLRRIGDNDKYRRYDKIILNPKNINSNTFYSIRNSLPLLYTNDINIHISEGTFDILSIYNMNNRNKENNYYFASCGFGYITILKYLIYNGINTGLNLNIYSDKDKKDSDHFKYLFKNSAISHWADRIILHRNGFENEKDYGVPLSNIIDTSFKVK